MPLYNKKKSYFQLYLRFFLKTLDFFLFFLCMIYDIIFIINKEGKILKRSIVLILITIITIALLSSIVLATNITNSMDGNYTNTNSGNYNLTNTNPITNSFTNSNNSTTLPGNSVNGNDISNNMMSGNSFFI